ncbi:MAG: hypothetical protein LBQ59_02165 [Candidatus Peribacteria bacterium]|nr:hypothetical protein [Candidatus Peribacteria bacterium]
MSCHKLSVVSVLISNSFFSPSWRGVGGSFVLCHSKPCHSELLPCHSELCHTGLRSGINKKSVILDSESFK